MTALAHWRPPTNSIPHFIHVVPSSRTIRPGRRWAGRVEPRRRDLRAVDAARLIATLRYAVWEEDFARILSAAVLLIILGTVAYAVGEDWNPIDALYFAVATLTTRSVADRSSTS